MLNLPSPQTALPLDLAAPATLPALVPAEPAPAALPVFAGVLAAQGPLPPVAADPLDNAPEALETAEPAAITQAWALVLVPELANLPAEITPLPVSPVPVNLPEQAPETGAVSGEAAGGSVAALNDSGTAAWPKRAHTGPRLAGLPRAVDPERVRNWQNGLPSGPPPVAATATSPAAPMFILRDVTGQPIPFPTADQPLWHDPQLPQAWRDPTQPAALSHDPNKRPPPAVPAPPPLAAANTLQPAPLTVAAPSVSIPLSVPVSAPAPAVVANRVERPLPPVALGPPVAAPIKAERGRRTAFDDQPAPAERPQPSANLPAFALAPPPAPAPPANPALGAAAPAPAAMPETIPAFTPALTVFSDRLGDVAVRLSGGPEQLQVTMQAQPAAAALIGADAPRLSQDLAAAGVALAGLSVNGQRADLSGGQRERQRQSPRRDETAPIAATRRLSARPALNHPATIDRFA